MLGVGGVGQVLVTASCAIEFELVAVEKLGGLNPPCIDQTLANLVH